MSTYTKRDATEAEIQQGITDNAKFWNMRNPSFEISIEEWREKQSESIAKGYKSEVCSCGVVFLAFHHMTTCSRRGCPFSDGVSILDRISQD